MKVLVVDSTGLSDSTDTYKSFFGKNVKLVGHEPSKKWGQVASGPHGYQCGYYAGALLQLLEGEHEVHFARIFDQNGVWISGVEDFILDVVNSVRPDVINNSYGMDDQDLPWGEQSGRQAWTSWAIRYRKLIDTIKAVTFFAAGNDDKNDLDEDVAFPQRLLPDTAHIIGSHSRAGKPSRFSGDGKGVECTMWGERVMLLNQYGDWEVGSGTSFASPKAAGLCAYLGLNALQWRKYVAAHSTRPDKFSGLLPHPKWGWGSLEYRYQEALSELPENLQPPLPGKRKLMYMNAKSLA